MFQLIQDFPEELSHALNIIQSQDVGQLPTDIRNIVISGMGGSGIGGSLVQAMFSGRFKVPVLVNKGYNLPLCAGDKTLFIACSYSGNTEETLQVFEEAGKRSCYRVAICSGGELSNKAKQEGVLCIVMPWGRPPRASLGYSITLLTGYLSKSGLLSGFDFEKEWSAVIEHIRHHKEEIKKQTFALASVIKDKLPVLYSDELLEAVSVRWKQQLNENAKMLCWHNIYPEMNHNELVGWREKNQNLALLFLMHGHEHPRVKLRMKMNEPVYHGITSEIHKIEASGHSETERIFYLIHFGDWLSYYLAEVRGYDPMEIDVLMKLKHDLSEIPT